MTDRTAPADPREALDLDLLREWAEEAREGAYSYVSMISPDTILTLLDRLAARQDEPSPALRPDEGLDFADELLDADHEVAEFLHGYLWGAQTPHVTEPHDGHDCNECYAQAERLRELIRLAANPPQTREAEGVAGDEHGTWAEHGTGFMLPGPDLCPKGCGCRLYLTENGDNDADANDCACDGPCTMDETLPRWSFIGDTGLLRQGWRTPEAQRDAPADSERAYDRDSMLEGARALNAAIQRDRERAGQRDAGNRGPADTCSACGHERAEHSSGGMCSGSGTECYCVHFPDSPVFGDDPPVEGISLDLSIRVSASEMATWRPERISRFFAGIAIAKDARGPKLAATQPPAAGTEGGE